MCFPSGTMNINFSNEDLLFSGPGGSLAVHPDDEISRRLAMLLAGECGGIGATGAARMFDFSRQRYYQLRSLYLVGGAAALAPEIPDPRPTTAAPTRSSAWPSVCASSIRMPPPRSSRKSSGSSATPSAPAASKGSSPITAFKKNSTRLIPPSRRSW